MSQIKDKKTETHQSTEFTEYVAGKLQKIVHALYLVTNLFPSDEPLRGALRQKGIELIATAEALRSTQSSNQMSLNISDSIRELLSLLSLARTSSLMSEMNFSVLKTECQKLISLQDEHDIYTGPFLSNGYFDLPRVEIPEKTATSQQKQVVPSPMSSSSSAQKETKKASTKGVSGVKKERRRSILEAISNGGKVSIKDVAKEVQGCSRKTIQRELGVLVDKGFVNKEGERRWSVYALTEQGKTQIS